MPVFFQIVLGCVSLLCSVVAVTSLIITMKTNVARQQQDLKAITDKEEKDGKDFHSFVVEIQSFISSQAEINKSVAGLLNALSDKVEDAAKQAIAQPLINKQVSDNLANIVGRLEGVSRSTTESNKVIEVLSELLRAERSRGV